jgi:hypothetical protein
MSLSFLAFFHTSGEMLLDTNFIYFYFIAMRDGDTCPVRSFDGGSIFWWLGEIPD